jgi:hypothetical protein
MRLFLTIGLLLSAIGIYGQPSPADSNMRQMAIGQALAGYYDFMGPQSLLYNGPEHPIDHARINGSAYLLPEPSPGTLVYDRMEYQNVPALYDIVGDHLIIRKIDGELVELLNEKLEEFWLAGRHFIRIQSGFYELICSGKITLLARRTKGIVESVSGSEIAWTAVEKDYYYARKNGLNYPLKNRKRSLLALMDDQKDEIRQFIRTNRIRFKKDPDHSLAQTAAYYNQLSH